MSSNLLKVPADFPDKTVCIFGLGFVGLTLATAMADAGFHVIGIEIRDEVLKDLNSGDPHFFEPGLSAHLKRVIKSGHLKVYKEIPKPSPASVYIITVGTPLDAENNINLTSMTNVSNEIAEHLKDGDLVILRSTVKLGTTRNVVKPLLEKAGKKLSLAFCPERTVEGQAMAELRYLPQIVGADNLTTSVRASQLFQFLTPTIVRVSDMETAELIKLIDNTKRDVLFAFSNEVARICDAVGLSAKEVVTSGRFGYSRTNLPFPGPVGGPCLSKDSHILAQSLESYGITPAITMASRTVNENQALEVVNFISTFCAHLPAFPDKPKIAMLGFAFKGRPETDDVRGSTAKPILEAVKDKFPHATYVGYDPVVDRHDIETFGVYPEDDLNAAFKDTNLVIIMNNHPAFEKMSLEDLASEMATPGVIYDFWNLYDGSLNLPKKIQYLALGSHQRPIKSDSEEN